MILNSLLATPAIHLQRHTVAEINLLELIIGPRNSDELKLSIICTIFLQDWTIFPPVGVFTVCLVVTLLWSAVKTLYIL